MLRVYDLVGGDEFTRTIERSMESLVVSDPLRTVRVGIFLLQLATTVFESFEGRTKRRDVLVEEQASDLNSHPVQPGRRP